VGSKHCQHCGTDVSAMTTRDATPLPCPRKCGAMRPVRFGAIEMYHCETCNGLWVETETLQRLIAERLKPAPMLGTGISTPPTAHLKLESVQYAPCPICQRLMNRVNFAHASGVIVDVCTTHGTWFDADELRRVLEFVTGGGLDVARARELRRTPTSVPETPLEDSYKIVRPLLDGDDPTLIINALATFAGRRKM
jgi:Zn-finger nucleic acid-binding protein